MTDCTEERLARLEELVDNQANKIERLEAARICENMFNRYEYYHVNEQHQKVIDMFAHTPGDRLYFGELGFWEGANASNRGWGMLMGHPPMDGTMHFHPTMCPVIEVAEDCQTAQAVWTTFGFESGKDPQTGEYTPKYAWGTYGIDFLKVDGEWKFWHFHIYRLVCTRPGGDWTKLEDWDPDQKGLMDELPPEIRPDYPGVDDYPFRVNKPPMIHPEPPLPYKTFSEIRMS